MISLPTDFTAPPVSPAPVLPTSSIAPKELIGNVNFPQLLGGFQASGATTKAVSGQEAPATKEPGLKASVSHVTQEFAARLPLAMQASGNALPSPGTSLPLDQMAGENGVNEGGAEGGPEGGPDWPELLQASDPSELKVQTASFDTGVKAVPVPIRTAQPTAQPDVGNRANAQQDGPPQSSAGAVAGVGAGLGARPDISTAQLAQLPVQTLPMPRADMSASRLAAGPDLRVQTDPSVKRSATGVSDVTQGLAANLLQPAVLNLGESDGDAELTRAAPPSAPSAAPQSSAQNSGQNPAQNPASGLQVAAAPINAQPSVPLPMTDTSAALRLAPQLADAIEQLAETRSAAQANKPELTLRHQEFGAITMRLDTTGGDLRATLSARDPGFVPAIQAALFERVVAMSGEAATAGRNNDQTGSNSQSQGNSQSGTSSGSQGNGHGQGQGQGWNSGAAYGSSTGSGQGTSQPYAGQTENRDEESGLDAGARTMGRGDGSEGEGEIFA